MNTSVAYLNSGCCWKWASSGLILFGYIVLDTLGDLHRRPVRHLMSIARLPNPVLRGMGPVTAEGTLKSPEPTKRKDLFSNTIMNKLRRI
jgi:hypothetical protein